MLDGVLAGKSAFVIALEVLLSVSCKATLLAASQFRPNVTAGPTIGFMSLGKSALDILPKSTVASLSETSQVEIAIIPFTPSVAVSAAFAENTAGIMARATEVEINSLRIFNPDISK
jgi:hypothetical protein